MKSKAKFTIKIILFLLGSLAACAGIYIVLNYVWNGVLLEWVNRHYIITDSYHDNEGNQIIFRNLDWKRLKELAFQILCVAIVIMFALVLLIDCFNSRRRTRQNVSKISRMIQEFMEGKKEESDVFPSIYSEISTQMIQIKYTMRHQEEVLMEEARKKNDLITYLAHDLKTPLTSVVGYLNLLQEAWDMPEEQRRKYIYITLDKANRLEKLINEFFEITRFNLHQILLEKETIDLYYMLVQMTDEFYPILAAQGNTAVLNADEDITLYGDPVKLARVFNNILKNAVAYSYPGTPVEVSVKETDSQMMISFRNQGKTIPRHKLDFIFEKFYRLDEARNTNTGGAGLGLAIAKEIVVLHGGTITAESENEITTFCVTLPI